MLHLRSGSKAPPGLCLPGGTGTKPGQAVLCSLVVSLHQLAPKAGRSENSPNTGAPRGESTGAVTGSSQAGRPGMPSAAVA